MAPRNPPRRVPDPWLRSIDESFPAGPRRMRHLTTVEVMIAVVVIGAVIAFAVWFLFFASGGPGLGTV